jgi:molybdenum cofactor cytidylyltransferase
VNLAGLILAGGASTRMGCPKALLDCQGETFLDRLIGILATRCRPVIVVLGHRAATIRAGLSRAGQATFVVNQNYPDGQLSSLQCGLLAAPSACDGVLFTPVDHPAVAPATVAALAEAFERRAGALVVIPRFRGRHGHPVCCAREMIPDFFALEKGSQAREVIHRHSSRTRYVDVDDPGILADVDDPEAYRSLIQFPERP